MRIETLVAPNPGAFTLDGTRSYVLEGSVVIDPGPAIDSHVDALVAALDAPACVLLTHRHADHVPAAAELRRRLSIPVWGPKIETIEVDRVLGDNERITTGGLELRVLFTPGHTSEHLCYLSDEGDLFTGDTLLGEGTTVIQPPDGDMGAYIATLQRLQKLEARMVWPGHGPARSDVKELIAHYLTHRMERERQVLDAIASGCRTAAEIRRRIYPSLDERLHGAAESQIEAHLLHLASRGLYDRPA